MSRQSDPVVSAAHLADSSLPALSEVEFAMMLANHAFQRWIVRGMSAAMDDGGPVLSPLDIMILHQINHRARPKTLADICLVLSIGDTHLATYAIRKLGTQGLVAAGRSGKEKTYAITDEGAALCERYAAIRERLVVQAAQAAGHDPADISRLAGLLRALSGVYDQAARAAAAM